MAGTLLLVAAAFGLGSYYGLSISERTFAIRQFNAVADSTLIEIQDAFDTMSSALVTLSSIYSNLYPDEDQWPYVVLPGFYETVPFLTDTSRLDSMLFIPMVEPEPNAHPSNQTEYEKYLWSYYASEPAIPSYPPPGVPTPELGGYGGIWSTGGRPYAVTISHDVTGQVNWGNSSTNALFPIAQSVFGGSLTSHHLGWNLHGTFYEDPYIDKVINCTKETGDYSKALRECRSVRPWTLNDNTKVVDTNVAFPILLKLNDSTHKMVGCVGGHFEWSSLLSRIVPKYVGEIDVVVTGAAFDFFNGNALRDDYTFMYTIRDGTPELRGIGDLHDKTYTKYGRTNKDVPIFDTLIDITFYPRDSFIDDYETDNPLYVSIGSVLLILLCSLVFVIYDFAVSRKSFRQEIVLDTKRRFVRYISHEVRTPLNTVRLGLKLFELELTSLKNNMIGMSAAALRDEVATCLENWIDLTNDVLGNSEAAVDVLSDLLNYDKIETGTLRLEFSMVAIWEVVSGVFKAFGMQAAQKSINLKLTGALWDAPFVALQPGQEEQHRRMGVVGDATRIAQVLRNLLSNALKFTPEQGSVTVQADWVQNGLPGEFALDIPEDQTDLLQEPRTGSIRISVTDSGAGLSEEQLAQICNEGVQFNANQLQAGQGSGLGLFISKGIVEQHGGMMNVASDGLGRGTTFTVELPLYALPERLILYEVNTTPLEGTPLPTAGDAGAGVGTSGGTASTTPASAVGGRDSTGARAAAAPLSLVPQERAAVSLEKDKTTTNGPHESHGIPLVPIQKLRVLVIDDALSNRKLLMRILRAKGYDCEEAEDGAKGVEKYQEMCTKGNPPDAVLSDYEMPVMIGPHAVLKMREMGCECFIVGITGNIMQSDIDYFKEHGADAVLAKPLNTDTFESLFKQFRQRPVASPRFAKGVSVAKSAGYAPPSKVQPFEETADMMAV